MASYKLSCYVNSNTTTTTTTTTNNNNNNYYYYCCRYNCNRYNEDEAKKARDAQEVYCFVGENGLFCK